MSDMMLLMLAGLGGELLLLVFVALVVSWARNRAARRRDAKAMQALVARVKQGKAEREALLGKFLSEQMGLSDEVLEEARTTMLRAELSLLQRFVHIYAGRDAAKAGRFDADLEAAIQPYHALAIAGEPLAAAEAGDVDAAELERLRAENGRLSDELRITMETMGRMLNEYSTMFAGGQPADDSPSFPPLAAATAEAADVQGGDKDATEAVAGDTAGDVASAPGPDAVAVAEDSSADGAASSAETTAGASPGADDQPRANDQTVDDDDVPPAVELDGAGPAEQPPTAEDVAAVTGTEVFAGEAAGTDAEPADIAVMVPEAAPDDASDAREMPADAAQATETESETGEGSDAGAVADVPSDDGEADIVVAEAAGPGDEAQPEAMPADEVSPAVEPDEDDGFGDVSVMLEEGDVELMDPGELDGIPMDVPADDDEALFDGFDEAITAAEEAADEAPASAGQKA